MKTINIIALLLFISTNAQTTLNGQVTYQEVYNSTTGEFKSNYELYFNNTQSIYLFNRDTTLSETKTKGSFSKLIQQNSSEPPFYFKKLNGNEVIFNSKTALKQYTVKDSITLNWTIHKENRIIGNYECSKATTEFRGRKYIAWFTTKIPVDYGPRKFSGLPGLILEIYDDKGVYKAYASEIKINENIDTEKVLNDINVLNPISYKDFLDKRCDDALEFKKIIESKMGRGSGRLQLTKVGSNENIEIDTEECIK